MFIFLACIGAHGCYREFAYDEPLYGAASDGDVEKVRELIREGADVNYMFDVPSTPLHAASQAGHVEVMEILLKAGADPNIKDASDLTPLDYAGNDKSIALLKRYGGKHANELR